MSHIGKLSATSTPALFVLFAKRYLGLGSMNVLLVSRFLIRLPQRILNRSADKPLHGKEVVRDKGANRCSARSTALEFSKHRPPQPAGVASYAGFFIDKDLLQLILFSAILIGMEFLTEKVLLILPWAQIILSIILGASILLQQTGAGVGGAFGGGDESMRSTRRGMEKVLFYLSIIVAILFALSAFVLILIQR